MSTSALEENPPLCRSNTECNDSKDRLIGALLIANNRLVYHYRGALDT